VVTEKLPFALNAKKLQQATSMPSVFARNHIRSSEDVHRTQSDVFQVACGCLYTGRCNLVSVRTLLLITITLAVRVELAFNKAMLYAYQSACSQSIQGLPLPSDQLVRRQHHQALRLQHLLNARHTSTCGDDCATALASCVKTNTLYVAQRADLLLLQCCAAASSSCPSTQRANG
jgi:hypothetical protein